MSYEDVIKKTKKIEKQLEDIGANGRGLHEKVSSVESEFEYSLIKKIRYTATIRNKLLHEDGFELNDYELSQFNETSDYIINELEYLHNKDNNSDSGDILVSIVNGIFKFLFGR